MKEKKVADLINLNSGEKIEFILHRHPFTFLKFLLFFLLLTTVPLFVYLLLSNVFNQLFQQEIIYALSILFGSIYYLSILLFLYTKFVDFYLDVWIITNRRIIDIVQENLFSRNISELDLDRIQDVTTDVSGIFPTLFDFGTLDVQTASQNVSIVFKDIGEPNKVRETIIHLSNEQKNNSMR